MPTVWKDNSSFVFVWNLLIKVQTCVLDAVTKLLLHVIVGWF